MKKAVALLLAAIMCIGAFAACGKDEKGADKDASDLQGFPSLGFGDKDKADDKTDDKTDGKTDLPGTDTPDTQNKPEEKPSVWADKLMYVDANGEWHFVSGIDGSGTDTLLGVYANTNSYEFDKTYILDDEDVAAYALDGENIYFAGISPNNKNNTAIYALDKSGNVTMLADHTSSSLLQKGGVVLFLTIDDSLYSCADGKAIKLADDVTYYRFSDDGEGVWFGRQNDDMDYSFWYVPANGNAPAKNIIPTNGARRVYFGTQKNVLIYNVEKEDPDTGRSTYSIYISRAGKTPQLIAENAVSATHLEYGDTFFYYSKESGKKALYWYDGEKSVLAADIGINELGDSDMRASGETDDQKIYYADSRSKDDVYTHTYVYKYGDTVGTVNCTTDSSYYYSYACGFLKGQEVFVTCGDKLVIHSINSQDPDDTKVIDIYDVTFFPETETLFCETEDDSLYVYENGESRLLMSADSWPKIEKLYGDKTAVLLEAEYENADPSYMSKGTLKICKGEDKTETMGTDCTFFTYTQEGRLLFVSSGVLYCYDGENTVRIADNVLRAYPGTLDKGQ